MPGFVTQCGKIKNLLSFEKYFVKSNTARTQSSLDFTKFLFLFMREKFSDFHTVLQKHRLSLLVLKTKFNHDRVKLFLSIIKQKLVTKVPKIIWYLPTSKILNASLNSVNAECQAYMFQYTHSVQIAWFFYHSDFTWNQF